jgi:Ca-activated chloride channel family protein
MLTLLFLTSSLAQELLPPVCEPWSDLAPPGQLLTADGAGLVLEHTAFEAEVRAGLAKVTVTQRYTNPYDEPIDATYIFPLPPRAAVYDLSLTCGERILRSRVLPVEEARKRFDDAAREGRKAALLSQQRPNLFTQEVASLCPGEVVEVALTYLEEPEYLGGTYTLTFPTTVGPRFDPGQQVDQPPLTPDTRAAHDLSVQVDLYEGAPLSGLWSDTHALEVFAEDDHGALVSLTEQDSLPNKDVVLSWSLSVPAPEATVVWAPGPKGEPGHLAFSLHPQLLQDLTRPRRREVILLIDGSGSMRGEPWEAAARATRGVLAGLRPADTFEVVIFGSTAHAVFGGSVPATPDNLDRARGALVWPAGGTDMVLGLRTALEAGGQGDALRLVLLLTDGYIGDEAAAFEIVSKHADHARVFALGVGSSPNEHLLDGVAELGRGAAFHQRPGVPTSEVVEAFQRTIAHPAMTDLTLQFEGLEVMDAWPASLPDLWVDRPVRLSARARLIGVEPVVTLRGLVEGRPYALRVPVQVEQADPVVAELVPLLWARRHLRALDLTPGRSPEEKEAIGLPIALRHGLVSPWTSRLVEDLIPSPCGPAHTAADVPSLVPAGVDPLFGGMQMHMIGTGGGMGGLGSRGTGLGGGGRAEGLGGGPSGHGSGSGSTATVAQIVTQPATVLGSMSKEAIDEAIKRRMTQLRYCYERELLKEPALKKGGKVVIRFTIGADGAVTKVEVQSSTLGSPEVEQCVAGRVANMIFPAQPGGNVSVVSYPLVFSAPEGG